MEGDDIGPEVVAATMTVMEAAMHMHHVDVEWVHLPVGRSAVASNGSTLPTDTVETLKGIRGWILGPTGTRSYPTDDARFVNPSGRLRKQFGLYANVRPVRGWPNVRCVHPGMDVVIVRENTEGFYADRNVLDGNGELRPNEDTVISVRLVTRAASLDIARQAFALARERDGDRRVTAVHKANVLRRGDGLFLEACAAIAADHPDVIFDDCIVDSFAMRLVLHPELVDVVVTTNMFGDILSDEAAGLIGGLGLAPGINIGEDHAMAQAVHGSAPDIAGRGIANPVAEILSGALLLRWLGKQERTPSLREAGESIERAVEFTFAHGDPMPLDLGGDAGTEEVTSGILSALGK